MKMQPTTTFRDFVELRFGGVLKGGSHPADGEACVLEAFNAWLNKEWSDTPSGLPDLRPLNDAFGENDVARTVAMLPLVEALLPWAQWKEAKRKDWVARVVKRHIQEILPQV